MKTKQNKGIFRERYNNAIGNTYYQEIKALIKKYYNSVSDAAIDAYIRSGNFAELTASELLARSGLDLASLEPDIERVATRFVDKLEYQSNAEFSRAYREAGKPTPVILRQRKYNQQQQNLIQQQVQKITGLLDYQYTRINEALQSAVVQNISLTSFKQTLRDAGLANEKRIKTIAQNQLRYATNITNTNKAMELGLNTAIWEHPPKGVYKTEPRPSHVAASGKTFKLNKGMKIDGEWIMPGQLPNCKCGYTIVI